MIGSCSLPRGGAGANTFSLQIYVILLLLQLQLPLFNFSSIASALIPLTGEHEDESDSLLSSSNVRARMCDILIWPLSPDCPHQSPVQA